MPSETETPMGDKLDTWAKLELMGHNRLAGRVSEATIAGGAFIRIDVPAVGSIPEYTRFFNPSAVYSITPVTEQIARGLAEEQQAKPVSVYDLPARRDEPRQITDAREFDDSRNLDDDDDPTDEYQYDRSARGRW